MRNPFRVKDRRRFLRLKAALFVCFRVDRRFYMPHLAPDQEVEATTLDIGQQGMAILSRYYIPATAVIIISCMLVGVDKKGAVVFSHPLELCGEVRSSISLGRKEYRLGVNFTRVTPEDRDQIDSFVSSVSSGSYLPAAITI